ncbi:MULTISPECIES: DUF211 domain-containing protein [unclassified Streptomyces]|uniref:DUF211 domain-containing protein n=1 Tax=unclassified Streptomyces TaxID=2593676 RepID=UPI000371FEC5|nr:MULTISPECIES: DUF211 domain-containing protein [unclassified Streptomyces]MYQ75823.1 hypothetical protein [Streptomyces sp. SID4923]NEC06186.1 DUF211 domain-containing protein [Streptomyces sp. SID7909]OKJ04695.1 hypothetical protein AMK18_05830 [Streptomyces sp. CB01249]
MPIRRLVLDVDKTIQEPDLVQLARAIEGSAGVQAVNIVVTEIDLETVGTDVTVEGEDIDVEALVRTIEHTGAVVHSTDQVVAGAYMVEGRPRRR